MIEPRFNKKNQQTRASKYTEQTCNFLPSLDFSHGEDYSHMKLQKQNGMHVGTYTPLLQLLIQNVLTYFSLVF
jgi:hypothetical protein